MKTRALGVAIVMLLCVSLAPATEQFAKEEHAKCTSCHDKAGSKLLTSKGKYYEITGSFYGYDELIKKYRKCTSCHSKFPGSEKLTRKGERLLKKGVTMDHVLFDREPVDGGEKP